jgi:hypothetical protein
MAAVAGVKGFQEGESGNPNGRPKGAVNATTIKFAKFKTLASEKYEDAFDILWEAMEAKEGWAHQIFFKELVPKKVHQPTVSVANGEGVNRCEAVTQAITDFTELTHEEALNEVRVLKAIEQKEEVAKPTDNVFSKLTDAQGRQLHLWLTQKE